MNDIDNIELKIHIKENRWHSFINRMYVLCIRINFVAKSIDK